MRRRVGLLIALLLLLPAAGSAAAAGDPYCVGNYAGGTPQPRALRFGVDPGPAGSIGPVQPPAPPDDPVRDLAALRALRPPAVHRGRSLVLRLNRLFFADGAAGIAAFRRAALADTRAGFPVEIQVRYHPAPSENGNLAAWRAYVRRVVDVLGAIHGVVAMTITNEVNVAFSPNTSDGAYSHAEDALIEGVQAAHREALRHGWRRLRFGFTYAYRFAPNQDTAFFAYLAAHGGAAFRRALSFVGLDVYPGTIYPPAVTSSTGYAAAYIQAAGTLRRCLMPMARIGRGTPIWVTENGIPSGSLTEAAQAAGLTALVGAVHAYAGTFNVTDYRWFNLRDSVTTEPPLAAPLSFSTDGLLLADYTRKPAFAAYRALIARDGR